MNDDKVKEALAYAEVGWKGRTGSHMYVLAAEVRRLQSANAALERDKERLDWLEANGADQFTRYADNPQERRWFDCITHGSDYHPTLRAAIDDAAQGGKS